MTYNILGVEWRSGRKTIGFVAYDCENPTNPGEWNSVVGVANEYGTEESDAQLIAAWGAKIEWKIASILFPGLDITKHKYYTGRG